MLLPMKKIYFLIAFGFAFYWLFHKSNNIQLPIRHSFEMKTWLSISATTEGLLKVQKRSSTRIPTEKSSKPTKVVRRETKFGNFVEKVEFFKIYWILQREMRSNFEKIKAPCRRAMEWHAYYVDRTPYRVSSVNNSIATLDIQPAGQYSRILIESYSLMNTEKNEGGDSWRVHIHGTSSVPVTLVDNQDGSYEASFLIIEPGKYRAEIFLDYTLCDGFKNPPWNWFIKGNSQGKNQPAKTLPNYERPFMIEPFGYVYFDVRQDDISIYDELQSELPDIYPRYSCYLLDGYGRWTSGGNEWQPYIPEAFIKNSPVKRKNGKGLLWVYGDSIGDLFYKANLQKPLCIKNFHECNRTYNWVYNIPGGNISRAQLENDDNDFSVEKIVSELKLVLEAESLDENSVLLLNYGLHYAQEIPFHTFIVMIDAVINTIKEARNAGKFRAQLLWKTTTAIQKWKWGDPKTNARHSIANRFLTSSRVQLYNALSTTKICEAGFPIIDVYPLTYAYPNGTGTRVKPWDAVHYEAKVFKTVEDYLIQYLQGD